MPVLSPVLWVVLIAAVLQCLTGLGWMVTSHKLDNAYVKLEKCKQDHAVFVDRTRQAGERAKEHAKQIETEQRRIADETAQGWARALDFVRADAARRMRDAASRSAGGSGLSATAQAGLTAPEPDADAIPSAIQLAQDCAVTTLTANALQDYIERIEILGADRGREQHE